MEQAGLSVEPGPLSHLEAEHQLNFDPNTDHEADGFDFGLDVSYDQVEQDVGGSDIGNGDHVNLDVEIGFEDEEGQAGKAGHEQKFHATEVAQIPGQDTEVDVEAGGEYEDEIGYEDDDPNATDIRIDLETLEPSGTDNGQETALADDGQEPNQLAENAQPETFIQVKDAVSHHTEPEDYGEGLNPQDDSGDVDEENQAISDSGHDAIDEAAHEEYVADQHDEPHSAMSDMDKAVQDLAHSLAGIPNVAVVYNEETYSLFGAPDDDPDTYFLDDITQLDSPLSEFLSCLRHVVAHEMSPADELVIRIDPLGLEFGERSSEKFLTRSFREILDCHSALEKQDPVVQLLVRRDSEEHFLELLSVAGLIDESDYSEDIEASEMHGELAGANPPTEGQEQHEPSEDGDSDEQSAEEQDTLETANNGVTAAQAFEDKRDSELEAGSGYGNVAGEQNDHQIETDQLDSSGAPQDDLEDDYLATHSHLDEHAEEGANEEQGWVSQAVEPQTTAAQHFELPLETSDRSHSAQTAGDESGGTANFGAGEAIASPSHDGYGQETGSNGKYLSSFSPTYHDSPHHGEVAELLSPQDVEIEDLSVVEMNHEETPISALEASQASAHTSQSVVTGTQTLSLDDDFFTIDYSDDEYEACPISQSAHTSQPAITRTRALSFDDDFWKIEYSDDEYEACPVSSMTSQGAPQGSSRSGPSSSSRPPVVASGVVTNSNLQGKNPTTLTLAGNCSDFNVATLSYNDADMLPQEDNYLDLAFDEDPGPDLTSIHEQEGDEHVEYSITYDRNDNESAGAEVAVSIAESHIAEDASDSASNNYQNGTHIAAVTETASIQTSATFDGDEIDYEEHDTEDNSLTLANGDALPPVTASGGENDEIDWENDEDDYEQPAIANDLEDDERKDITLSPSSLAGKRSRTDDEESLAEETGTLGFPPLKRLRVD
jgi:hypothetical protein